MSDVSAISELVVLTLDGGRAASSRPLGEVRTSEAFDELREGRDGD